LPIAGFVGSSHEDKLTNQHPTLEARL
jgi:hypothetical protein